jgi:hypothetical protein
MKAKEVAEILLKYPEYDVEIMIAAPHRGASLYAIAPVSNRNLIQIIPIIRADRKAGNGKIRI